MVHRHRHQNGEGPRRENAVQTLTTGLVLTVVFGVAATLYHPGWVFPLIFAGILPTIRGIRGVVTHRLAAKEAAKALSAPPSPALRAQAEKEILLVAKESGGVVTPALAALRSSLSIDLAEELLQDLARRGHAAMTVGDDGRVEYRFPELGPRLEGPEGGPSP